jgi:hypothetical protein
MGYPQNGYPGMGGNMGYPGMQGNAYPGMNQYPQPGFPNQNFQPSKLY